MTDDEIKAECETRFQRGHSRMQLVNVAAGRTGVYRMFRSMDNRREAKLMKSDSDRIFARSKTVYNGRVKYEWKEIK